MGTIAENLLALQETKQAFKEDLESKEIDLTGVPFTEYPNKYKEVKTTEDLDTELTEQETLLNSLEEDVNALSDKDDTALKILNNTLEEFDNKQYGLTEIRNSLFRGNSNLKKVDLTGITTIGPNGLGYCYNVEELIMGENITTIHEYGLTETGKNTSLSFDIKSTERSQYYTYSLYNSNVKKIDVVLNNPSSYAISNCSKLKEVYLYFVTDKNGYSRPSGSYLLNRCANVDSFYLNPLSYVSEWSTYCFYGMGRDRENPENKVFIFDAQSGSSSVAIRSSCFRWSKYFDIFVPNDVTSIESNAFSESDHYNVYMRRTTPPTLNTSAFGSGTTLATNYKIFAPYEYIKNYKTATNWVTHADYIYGWCLGSAYGLGVLLPVYNSAGNKLTWYKDKDMTITATIVEDVDAIYYCSAEMTESETITISNITAEKCSVNITDSNGNSYDRLGKVPIGTELTISIEADDNCLPYLVQLNGQEISNPYTYVTVSGEDILLEAIYYEDNNSPVKSEFNDNSWSVIKKVIQDGNASDYWTVGQIKEIEIQGNIYGIRLSDMQKGRYQYANSDRTTNAVLEFVQVYTTYRMNDSSTNLGGWASMSLKESLNGYVLSQMPVSLRTLLEEVVIASANGGSSNYTGITTSNNKLFLPCAAEVNVLSYNGYPFGVEGEGTTWDYYIDAEDSKRVKYDISNNADYWWLRSPYPSGTKTFSIISSSGGVTSYDVSYIDQGVAPCFAW